MKTSISLLLILFVVHTGFTQSKKGFDLGNSTIPIDEIKDGGPPRDGIPSIDSPEFRKVNQAALAGRERILGVFANGVAKAYPVNILNYHEIVNDDFDGQPVVVTYCPLCGSGIAFNSVVDGKPLTFGVSGMLYNSDMLLYDRETESLWSQLKYEAISGPMVGKQLEMINTTNTIWKEWKQRHPNTLLLSENTGYKRDYSRDPYPGYDRSSALYFSVSEQDDRYHPKETVIGLEIKGKSKAYPFSELAKLKGKQLDDEFQGKKLVVKYDPSAKSAEIFDAEGNPVPAVTNFWFAWYAFHPETEVYKN